MLHSTQAATLFNRLFLFKGIATAPLVIIVIIATTAIEAQLGR